MHFGYFGKFYAHIYVLGSNKNCSTNDNNLCKIYDVIYTRNKKRSRDCNKK